MHADPAIGEEDLVGGEDVFAAEAALLDFPAVDHPFADDAGAGAAGAVGSVDVVSDDEEDVGRGGGDEFGAVVEEEGLVEAFASRLGEGVGVEPVIGGFQAAEGRLVAFVVQADFQGVGGVRRRPVLDEDEEAGLRGGAGWRAIAGGDVNAGEAAQL